VGVFAGPKVVSDGLVLSLDPGNIFKSVDSTSNNFLQNGSFAGGLGVTYEAGSNPTNTIIELENPGDSNYVLRQNGSNTEYQMNIDGGAQGTLSASTQYVMSGWYATSDDYNGGDTMFHARAYSTGGSHNATGNGIGTLLYSVEIGGLTWEYRYQTITTPSDYSGNFDWYMGYGTTNTTGYRYYTGLKVEEGSFPSLLDLSRSGNDAKVINGTSYSSANGGSLVFDGVDDHITISYNASLKPATAITMEAFCYIQNNGTSWTSLIQYPVNSSSHTSPFFDWAIYLNMSSRSLHTRIDGEAVSSPDNVWNFNEWTYIAITFENQSVKYYVNGASVGSSSVTKTSITYDANNPVYIGKNASGNEPFEGKLGSMRVYNKDLTASEIQQNFNALRGRFGI